MEEYEEIYYDYKAEVEFLIKDLDQAIKDNTEYLNDGEAWVKVQHIATELDDLKGVI